jgi:hypothetical protein
LPVVQNITTDLILEWCRIPNANRATIQENLMPAGLGELAVFATDDIKNAVNDIPAVDQKIGSTHTMGERYSTAPGSFELSIRHDITGFRRGNRGCSTTG